MLAWFGLDQQTGRMAVALAVAFLLGGLIGLERQYRQRMAAELEKLNYPVSEIETLSESDEVVELAAILVPTSADPKELDHVVVALEKQAAVRSATWSVGTLG